jgi:hypothetical protein
MTTPFIKESNIFGAATTLGTSLPVEQPSTDPTSAGQLIDHLKFVADTAISQAGDRADWLALAANAGQNNGPQSLVTREYTMPSPILSSAIVNGWTLPKLPDLLTLPNLPDALKIDAAKLHDSWTVDINALKSSWMATFLPAVTDLSAITAMLTDVLNGSAQASFEARLNTLETNNTAALGATIASTLATLAAAIASSTANLTSNITTQKANIAAAIAAANDPAQNLAWSRQRDQIAREGKRLEDETITSWAARGWTIPPGALVSLLAQRRQATLNANVDAATEQAIKVHQYNVEVAKTTIDSWLRTLELQNHAEIESYRINVESYLKYAGLQLDANRANAELAIKHLGLTLDFTRFSAEEAVKYRLGVIGGMNDLVRAYGALRGNETENLRAIAAAQQQAVAAFVEYYRAAMASADIGLRIEQANTDTALRWASTAAQFIGTAVGHHVQAAAAAADSFSRTAAMALSGLNGVASVASQLSSPG